MTSPPSFQPNQRVGKKTLVAWKKDDMGNGGGGKGQWCDWGPILQRKRVNINRDWISGI